MIVRKYKKYIIYIQSIYIALPSSIYKPLISRTSSFSIPNKQMIFIERCKIIIYNLNKCCCEFSICYGMIGKVAVSINY